MTSGVLTVRLRNLEKHPKQRAFVESKAKRKIARAGRRGGKTVGAATIAELYFLAGGRVLYGAPTDEQVDAFWYEVKRALAEPIAAKVYYKNETEHVIEVRGTQQRIRAKTCWNADTLRGDFASLLILDEWHLMNESAWEEVGAPMLLDNNGDAIFIYTPPSRRSRSVSKARDPMHAPKMFKAAQADPRWAAFHWSSRDNPMITAEALTEVTADMTALAIRQEIEAEDVDVVPGALWRPETINYAEPPHAKGEKGEDLGRDLVRVVVAVDPAGGGGDEIGIVVPALGSDGKGYVLEDRSVVGSPDTWAKRAVHAYHEFKADRIVAESNYGGDMVRHTIATVDRNVPVTLVNATRGKAVRADPVSALYEQGRAFHVRAFPELEAQLLSWTPESGDSPDRLDALVWGLTELMVVSREWGIG